MRSKRIAHPPTSGSRSGAVAIDGGVRVRSVDRDTGLAEAHRRYGGIDVPAILAGMSSALGAAVVLGGLAAAAGTVGYQQGVRSDTEDVSFGGFVAGLLVLLIAFLIGGWVTGRMSRYDGARNGALAAVAFIVLAAGVAALGAWLGGSWDFFDAVHLPQWFADNATTATGMITGGVAVAVMVVAAVMGGKLGERYHRRADDVLLTSRSGGITRPAPTQPEGHP